MIKYVTQVLGKVKDIFKISFACFSLFFPIWLQKKKKKRKLPMWFASVSVCNCRPNPTLGSRVWP